LATLNPVHAARSITSLPPRPTGGSQKNLSINMSQPLFEALVIGGGPAGLSAALYLARYDRHVALFDAGRGRSTWHQVNQNYLGFPGGVPACELRRLGRQQLAAYHHVTVLEHKVEALRRDGD
jgi:thioredoxin reductase (NADPH)